MATTAKLAPGVMEAAKTLDVGAALTLGQVLKRSVYRNDDGVPVTIETFALAGLHSVRSRFPAEFAGDQVSASAQWLKANGFVSLIAV